MQSLLKFKRKFRHNQNQRRLVGLPDIEAARKAII
jgi:hypothetical protein